MLARAIQFVLAVVIGAVVFNLNAGATYQANMLGALVVGVLGSYLLTKLYVRILYGKEAARSFKWDGN